VSVLGERVNYKNKEGDERIPMGGIDAGENRRKLDERRGRRKISIYKTTQHL